MKRNLYTGYTNTNDIMSNKMKHIKSMSLGTISSALALSIVFFSSSDALAGWRDNSAGTWVPV